MLRLANSPTRETKLESKLRLQRDHFGPLSPEATKLQETLSSGKADPFVVLKQHIDSGEASLDIIRVCLGRAIKQIYALKRRDRPSALSKQQHHVAAHVLRHLWADIRIWMPFVLYDQATTVNLCYFAVAEGLGDYVERWIKADVSEEKSRANFEPPIKEGEHWRNDLLRCLIEAISIHDYRGCSDAEINCLLRLQEWRKLITERDRAIQQRSTQAKQHFANLLGLWPATRNFLQRITSGHVPDTDAGLFERFQNLIRSFLGQKSDKYNVAQLALYHPDSPDARPLMAWWRDLCEAGTFKDPHSLHDRLIESLQRQMRRAYAVLGIQARFEDAKWIADQYKDVFGSEIKKDLLKISKHEEFSLRGVELLPGKRHVQPLIGEGHTGTTVSRHVNAGQHPIRFLSGP